MRKVRAGLWRSNLQAEQDITRFNYKREETVTLWWMMTTRTLLQK